MTMAKICSSVCRHINSGNTEIMDMSFGVQLASLRELLTHEGELAPGLHDLPREADYAVAAAALAALSLS